MNNNNVNKFFIVILLKFSLSTGNIGGVFYKNSIAGFSIDSSKTIISAETVINCSDSTCSFKTTYHVNSSNCTFSGKFYGIKFSNIFVNGNSIDDSLIKKDSLNPDSDLFKRMWVLEDYSGRTKLQSIPITVEINDDSIFTIQGVLHTSKSENWGLAVYPNMVSLRHLWLNRPTIYNNEYNVTYIFAPIESFIGLKKLSIQFNGQNISLLKRKWHRSINSNDLASMDSSTRYYASRYNYDKDTTIELSGNNDSISWGNNFPDVIEYFFKINKIKEKKYQYITPGGPILLIGARSKKFHTEIGWEGSINPSRFLSILPSATAAFNTRGYMDWNIGLRGYYMGFSLGVNTREFKSAEITFGVDFFGIIGIEGRNNAILAKLSI
jgi:hypothetical protein